jgi:hypothetical protein
MPGKRVHPLLPSVFLRYLVVKWSSCSQVASRFFLSLLVQHLHYLLISILDALIVNFCKIKACIAGFLEGVTLNCEPLCYHPLCHDPVLHHSLRHIDIPAGFY